MQPSFAAPKPWIVTERGRSAAPGHRHVPIRCCHVPTAPRKFDAAMSKRAGGTGRKKISPRQRHHPSDFHPCLGPRGVSRRSGGPPSPFPSHSPSTERFQHVAVGARPGGLSFGTQEIAHAHTAAWSAPVAPIPFSAGCRRWCMSGFSGRQRLRRMQARRIRVIVRRRCAAMRGPGIPGIIRIPRLGR